MKLEVTVAGEQLVLLPERAVYWPRAATLLVADTHWGKAATLRAAAIPIPGGTTSSDMQRLTGLVELTGARRMVLLGDAIHAREGRAALKTVAEWRKGHAELDILLVRGNHDRRSGDPSAELNIRCADAPVLEPPFAFQHYPGEAKYGYALAGHMHPAIRLTGRGKEKTTLACFWFSECCGVLPAFGSLTGAALVGRAPGDRVYVIAGEEIIPV
ncbi:MAG: ligase-associated DNA damage response endonuclease PdeM [Acidobacteriota bacterium]|nr:ligase-associated DNA damage response endonuclease PdeM [Acidobacteriota bacterium]